MRLNAKTFVGVSKFELLLLLLVGLGISFLIFYPTSRLFLASFGIMPTEIDFTTKWYVEVFIDPILRSRLINTLLISAGTVAVSLATGSSLAYVLVRTDTPFARRLEFVAILPFVVPPLIGALAWGQLASPRFGLLNVFIRNLLNLQLGTGPLNIYSVGGILFVMGLFYSPYAFLMVSAALKRMDPTLEECSRVAGAGALKTALRVTLPIIKPAIGASALLIFIFALGNFSIVALLGNPAGVYVYTLSIYEQMNRYPTNIPLAATLGIVSVLISFVILHFYRSTVSATKFVTITGKGFRPTLVRLGRWKYVTLVICTIYFLLTVGLPFFALSYSSLIPYWSPYFDLSKLTFGNYLALFTVHGETIRAIQNSFMLAFFGALVCVLTSTIVSYIILKSKIPGRWILDYISLIPICIPGVIFAVGMLVAWIRGPIVLYGTIWILLLAYLTHFLPTGVKATSSTLVQVHDELLESAKVSGASFPRIFRTIILPLVKPGLMAAWTSLFLVFMREFSTSIMLYSPKTIVVSVLMFEFYEYGQIPEASALSIVLVAITICTMLVMRKISGTAIKEAEVY